MTSKIELSRNQFYGIWILIAVLVLALLLVLLKWPSPPPAPGTPQPSKGGLILDGKRAPVSPELTAFLKREGYPAILLPQENGGIKIVNQTGGEIPPCRSQKRKTGVECPPFRNVAVEQIDQISILTVEVGNPTACKDYKVDGDEVRVHKSGTNAGLAPCEPSGSHSHSAP